MLSPLAIMVLLLTFVTLRHVLALVSTEILVVMQPRGSLPNREKRRKEKLQRQYRDNPDELWKTVLRALQEELRRQARVSEGSDDTDDRSVSPRSGRGTVAPSTDPRVSVMEMIEMNPSTARSEGQERLLQQLYESGGHSPREELERVSTAQGGSCVFCSKVQAKVELFPAACGHAACKDCTADRPWKGDVLCSACNASEVRAMVLCLKELRGDRAVGGEEEDALEVTGHSSAVDSDGLAEAAIDALLKPRASNLKHSALHMQELMQRNRLFPAAPCVVAVVVLVALSIYAHHADNASSMVMLGILSCCIVLFVCGVQIFFGPRACAESNHDDADEPALDTKQSNIEMLERWAREKTARFGVRRIEPADDSAAAGFASIRGDRRGGALGPAAGVHVAGGSRASSSLVGRRMRLAEEGVWGVCVKHLADHETGGKVQIELEGHQPSKSVWGAAPALTNLEVVFDGDIRLCRSQASLLMIHGARCLHFDVCSWPMVRRNDTAVSLSNDSKERQPCRCQLGC